MNGPGMAFVFICTVILVLVFFVRPGMPPRGRLVWPEIVGLNVGIKDLKKDHQGYDVYYSGRLAVPSALVFVPRTGMIRWVLPGRGPNCWKKIVGTTMVEEVLARLEDRDMGTPGNQLRVVLPPGDIHGRLQDLCLIYTAGFTVPYRQGKEGDVFVLPAVPDRTKREYDQNK